MRMEVRINHKGISVMVIEWVDGQLNFLERPMATYGGESYTEDLATRLKVTNGLSSITRKILDHLDRMPEYIEPRDILTKICLSVASIESKDWGLSLHNSKGSIKQYPSNRPCSLCGVHTDKVNIITGNRICSDECYVRELELLNRLVLRV